MARRFWSAGEVEFVRRAKDAGMPEAAIGAALGRTISSIAQLCRREKIRTDAAIRSRREEKVREMWGVCSPGKIANRLGVRKAVVLAIAAGMGLADYGKWKKAPKPQQTGISKAQIAWAIENFRTDPEARAIAVMLAFPVASPPQ